MSLSGCAAPHRQQTYCVSSQLFLFLTSFSFPSQFSLLTSRGTQARTEQAKHAMAEKRGWTSESCRRRLVDHGHSMRVCHRVSALSGFLRVFAAVLSLWPRWPHACSGSFRLGVATPSQCFTCYAEAKEHWHKGKKAQTGHAMPVAHNST